MAFDLLAGGPASAASLASRSLGARALVLLGQARWRRDEASLAKHYHPRASAAEICGISGAAPGSRAGRRTRQPFRLPQGLDFV